MRKQIVLILPLVAAMVSVAGIHGFRSSESLVAQNASTSSNMTTGTNMSAGNASKSNTTGTSAKSQLGGGIKALESGIKEGAMTQLTAAQQAMQGSSSDAIMHFKEGMKALESGDSNGAIMHLKVADQFLG